MSQQLARASGCAPTAVTPVACCCNNCRPTAERRRRARRQLAARHRAGHTLTADELLSLDNETVLHRLYHEEQVRLFDVQNCASVAAARANVRAMRWSAWVWKMRRPGEEHGGKIEIDCQFCNQRYLFDAADVAQLFAGAGVDTPSDTRH
jgi:redox-regulated HSP33 family molecular chaperone